jgi:uncharacterized membrane protein
MASRTNGPDLAAFAAIGMAAGLCGLGALSLIYQDYALQWEPVPASWPAHTALGAASGMILLASGIMLAMRRTRALGAALAAVFIGLWVVGLHLPKAFARPGDLPVWLAVAECTAMAVGAFIASRELGRGPDGLAQIAVRLFGLCCLVFGASHFLFASFTASMVPAWLPRRLDLAYLTGAVHVLTGLALLLGVWQRPAAVVEALMMTSFVVLVHLHRVAARPGDRTELTLLFVAVTLSSAAWLVATSRAAAQR